MTQAFLQPHSPDAEATVLGAILVHSRQLAEVLPVLGNNGAAFYHPANGRVYEAMVDLRASSSPIDTVTVFDRMLSLGTADCLNALRREEYLFDLTTRLVTAGSVAHHARLIAAKARRRTVGALLREHAARFLDESIDDEGLTEDLMRELVKLTVDPKEDEYRPLKKILYSEIKEVEERYTNFEAGRDVVIGLPSGLLKYDQVTLGFHPGELTIVGARPSMGKTALAVGWAQHLGSKGIPSLIISLEMTGRGLVERMWSSESRVNSYALASGAIKPPEWLRLTGGAGRLAEMPIDISERAFSLEAIRAMARRWRLKEGDRHPEKKGAIVVDYAQIVEVLRKNGRVLREQEVSEIARGMKAMAKELMVPVILLAQLNRDVEKREDKRPRLSDLRESGSFEQEADVVTFIYRDEVYNPESDHKGRAELIIAKHRNKICTMVPVRFQPEFTKFSDVIMPLQT